MGEMHASSGFMLWETLELSHGFYDTSYIPRFICTLSNLHSPSYLAFEVVSLCNSLPVAVRQ